MDAFLAHTVLFRGAAGSDDVKLETVRLRGNARSVNENSSTARGSGAPYPKEQLLWDPSS